MSHKGSQKLITSHLVLATRLPQAFLKNPDVKQSAKSRSHEKLQAADSLVHLVGQPG